MPRPLRHLLICSNNRGPSHPRGSCGEKGGEKLAGLMKDLIRESGLKDTVLVSRTGCLKHCSRGVTAAVYPENVWYQGVGEADLPEICESHLKAGTPVARLLVPEDAPWE
ncbi:MAG TPA: (2Fe-2S) ferredoxin domain-containing protein [Vicinamibacteria bacterium]|nr:(2Fe-2S) ferredoxin domain-containing protein [Vicinamibacteria bacterium]HRB13846.1 (2Fe-2S) ferredoxin domain-containing protein [Vicinamibacteria bacterium]